MSKSPRCGTDIVQEFRKKCNLYQSVEVGPEPETQVVWDTGGQGFNDQSSQNASLTQICGEVTGYNLICWTESSKGEQPVLEAGDSGPDERDNDYLNYSNKRSGKAGIFEKLSDRTDMTHS